MDLFRRKNGLVSSAVMWSVVLGMLMQFAIGPAVAPEARVGGLAKGITECANSGGLTCDADVTLLEMQLNLELDEGDTVHYGFFVYWYDNRTGVALPQTYHYFNLTVTYQSVPVSDEKGVYTYGSTSGSDYVEVFIYDADENERVYVDWYASINVNSGDCTDSDSINTSHHYV